MAEKLTAQLSHEGRLAVITIRTILTHEGSEFEYGKTALKHGASAFEARFIELACHWGNDLMDLCLAELAIEIPEHLQPSRIDLLEPRHLWLVNQMARFPVYAELPVDG